MPKVVCSAPDTLCTRQALMAKDYTDQNMALWFSTDLHF